MSQFSNTMVTNTVGNNEQFSIPLDQYSMYVVTIQSIILKSTIEALKEILPDTNMEINADGIKILSMDPTHTTLVHLNLCKDNFEVFHSTHKQVIGVNMVNFFKLIKTLTSNDILSLFIEKDDINHLGIKIENSTKKSSTTFKLNLMDLSDEIKYVPPAKFTSVITMKSTDFQKICRDMSNISEEIEIKSVAGQLILTCKGEFAQQETILGESTQGGMSMTTHKDEEDIVQGVFSLKYLTLFTKCTNLCQTTQIFLKNDYPLIICYNVGSLGEIKMCLAPKYGRNDS